MDACNKISLIFPFWQSQGGLLGRYLGMKFVWRFSLWRIFQALIIGLVSAGLMLSQVAAVAVNPRQPSLVPFVKSQIETSPTGRYWIFFEGESALQSTKANKGQIQSALVRNKVTEVQAAQVHQVKAIEKQIGRKLLERKHFDLILNAVAAPLSLEEAELIAALPGVKAVQPVRILELATDAGPTWVGAPQVWDDPILSLSSTSMGEGVIIGMLDTGINFDHPSFASDPAISGDTSGYVFPTPKQYFGVCQTNGSPCNDKLIGAYFLRNGNGSASNFSPEDTNGHGSHTASIAAGNRGIPVTWGGYSATISGMAPHAQLISYYVCDYYLCSELDLAAGVQQAMLDGVDVISYSISSEDRPYNDPVALAFLEAYKAGIFVAAAAANASGIGPTQGSVNHLEPWASTVAATSHDRRFPPGPDIRGSFSLQGPAANGLELLKPDLAAPGVNILAAYMDGKIDEDHFADVGIISGTSMSTPFVAGAAALLISANPEWTPAEVKSALMLTAKTAGIFKDVTLKPADPFDIGSGRIQVDLANATGLVMDESATNMAAANPMLGGDPKTLNLVTMQNNACFKQCSWMRTLKSVSANEVTYKITNPPWMLVEPAQFTIAPRATQSLKITAQNSNVPTEQLLFAQIDLVPNTANLPPLHLTAAVFFTPIIRYYFPFLVK
jgi:subtilisin family serine protease